MHTRLLSPLSLVVTLALLLPAGGMPAGAHNRPVTPAPAASDHASVAAALQSAGVMFSENTGQFPAGARFQVRSGDRTFWLTEDALWVTVLAEHDTATQRFGNEAGFPAPLALPPPAAQKGVNIKLSFGGANAHPRIEPFDPLDTIVSYFIGNEPDHWRPDVPVWGGVRYVDLYPGIDLEVAGENKQMALRLVAHPGADLSAVRLQVDGAEALTLEGTALHLATAVSEFTLPLLQVAGAANTDLARPTIVGDLVVRPFVLTVSRPQSTIANPQSSTSDLLYATLLGGWGGDDGLAIAVDGSVTRVTTPVPTAGAAWRTVVGTGSRYTTCSTGGLPSWR